VTLSYGSTHDKHNTTCVALRGESKYFAFQVQITVRI